MQKHKVLCLIYLSKKSLEIYHGGRVIACQEEISTKTWQGKDVHCFLCQGCENTLQSRKRMIFNVSAEENNAGFPTHGISIFIDNLNIYTTIADT